jgi:hypothetical protein
MSERKQGHEWYYSKEDGYACRLCDVISQTNSGTFHCDKHVPCATRIPAELVVEESAVEGLLTEIRDLLKTLTDRAQSCDCDNLRYEEDCWFCPVHGMQP